MSDWKTHWRRTPPAAGSSHPQTTEGEPSSAPAPKSSRRRLGGILGTSAPKAKSAPHSAEPLVATDSSTAALPSGHSLAPRGALGVKRQLLRLVRHGKFTNNGRRLAKDERDAAIMAGRSDLAARDEIIVARDEALAAQDQTIREQQGAITARDEMLAKKDQALKELSVQTASKAYLSMPVVEELLVKPPPHNNRLVLRGSQDNALVKKLKVLTKIPFPQGFEDYMYMYNPADCMIVKGDKGKPELALAEFNAQSYQGSTTVPEEVHEDFMAHYHRIGKKWRDKFERKNTGKPMIVLVGSFGGKDITDKLIYGEKVAEGMGPDSRCMHVDTALRLLALEAKEREKPGYDENAEKKYWPPKQKNLVIVGDNKKFHDALATKDVQETRVASICGLDVTHVMSDRLAFYMHSAGQIDLKKPSIEYCNITLPEGNTKHETFERQSEFNAKIKESGQTGAGMEKHVFHAKAEADPRNDSHDVLADKFFTAVMKASREDEKQNPRETRGDIVIKSSGTAAGNGVVLIEKKHARYAREIFKSKILNEVKPFCPEDLGFPYSLQTYFPPYVLNGKIPELRIVPYPVMIDGVLQMVAVPAIVKTGNKPTKATYTLKVLERDENGELIRDDFGNTKEIELEIENLWKSNVTASAGEMSEEQKKDPDYLSSLAEAGCSLENLSHYGITEEMLISACQYVAGLAMHAVITNMEKQKQLIEELPPAGNAATLPSAIFV